MERRALGYIPDPPKLVGQTPDFRAGVFLGEEEPPASASAREHILDIRDQGQLGMCVGFAAEQACRADRHRQGETDPGFGSVLFGHYHARAKTGREKFDEGTFIRDYLERRSKLGCCDESAWPYLLDTFNGAPRWATMPDTEAFRLAFDSRAPMAYYRIAGFGETRIRQVKQAIARKRMVVFGAMVSERFCFNAFAPNGFAPEPGVMDPTAGGHAMVLAEYDEHGAGGPNSWGQDFGLGGWFKFRWSYLGGPLCSDFWIVEQAPRLSSASSAR